MLKKYNNYTEKKVIDIQGNSEYQDSQNCITAEIISKRMV